MKIAVLIFAFAITMGACGRIPHSEPRRIPLDVRSEGDDVKRWSWNEIKDKVSNAVNDVKNFKNEVDASIDKAKNELDKMGKTLGSKFDGVKNVFEKISVYLTNSTTFECKGQKCLLCFKVPTSVDSDKTSDACINVTLDVDNYGVNGKISFDGKVVMERAISAKKPGSMCVPLPQIPVIQMCVRPYELDLKVEKKEFKICLETSMAAFSKQMIGINLNCFLLEDGKDFYLVRPTQTTKGAFINLDTGKLVPNFEKKLKLAK